MDPRASLSSCTESTTHKILEKGFCKSTGETNALNGAYNTSPFPQLKWLGPPAVSRQIDGIRPLRTALKPQTKSNDYSALKGDSAACIDRSNATAYVLKNDPMVLEGVSSFCKKAQPPVLTLSLKQRVEQPQEVSDTTGAFRFQARQRSLRQPLGLRNGISKEPHFAGPSFQWEVKQESPGYGDVPSTLRKAAGVREKGKKEGLGGSQVALETSVGPPVTWEAASSATAVQKASPRRHTSEAGSPQAFQEEARDEESPKKLGQSNDQQCIRATPRSEHSSGALVRKSKRLFSGGVVLQRQRHEDTTLGDGDSPEDKGSNHCTSSSFGSADTGRHRWSRSSSGSEHQAPPVGSDRSACGYSEYTSNNKRRTTGPTGDGQSESNCNDKRAAEASPETTLFHDEQSQSCPRVPVLRKLSCTAEALQGVSNCKGLRRSQGEAAQAVSVARLKGWRRASRAQGRFAFRQARSSGVIAAKFLSALGAPTSGRRSSVHAQGGGESPESSSSDLEGDHNESTRPLMWRAESFEGTSWLVPLNKECET
ncbi:hypothetical protein Emag_001395 [Eimeria magna]